MLHVSPSSTLSQASTHSTPSGRTAQLDFLFWVSAGYPPQAADSTTWVLVAGLLIMFFLSYFGMLSGGALGSLFGALIASECWRRGFPALLSLGPTHDVAPARKLVRFGNPANEQRMTLM